ncbi:MAG: hypothetical protein HY649_02115 [Acidobacteria bacterium]|nr:hypothetical protein [Acidobacteriota bacterium]
MPPSETPAPISAVVEGRLDEAIMRAVIRHAGGVPGPIYGKKGKQYIQRNLNGYNQAANHAPWVVLVDLDQDADCAPPLRAAWLPHAAPLMCFRVAVREVEAWIMADRARLARFLGVEVRSVPDDAEAVADPKDVLVRLARRSRWKDIRQDMVPRPHSGRETGPAYNARLIEFVGDETKGWRPEVAAHACESLRRCLNCLRRLVALAR